VTFDLVVAGKLAIDELSFQGVPSKPVLGGSAAHVAIAAATLGSQVAIVSAIGDDFPKQFLKMLESKDIDLSGVVRRPGRSSHFWADFTKNGTMSNYRLHFGVGNQLSFQHFNRLSKNAKAVHLGILPPYLQRALIKRIKGRGPLLSMTTIFHQAQTLRDQIVPQLASLDLLFLNAKEAMFLTGTADTIQAIRRLGEQVPLVVVTQGPDGCIVNQEGQVQHMDSYPVKEIDATGAGDSFAGAFLASYLKDRDIIHAAKWGNAAGAFNVQDLGCSNLVRATREDLVRLINSPPKSV
jgi:sugar/nucleoside kinase (ribokinase family)